MDKKYGLQLRVKPSQAKKPASRPPLPTPLPFGGGANDNSDEDDVEREISRQAYKNKSLKDIEEQHKKALEEDPSVFDYDGVYDDMKQKAVRPVEADRQQRKPKYIQMLLEKAKVREREHEVIYERKIAKERSKDDHLYADKDKFVTSAYKKKLAEQAKWLEEERLRELLEERDDVTKKTDITDFYFNLSQNVAFGAQDDAKLKRPVKQEMGTKSQEELPSSRKAQEELPSSRKAQLESPKLIGRQERGTSVSPREQSKNADANPVSDSLPKETAATEPLESKELIIDHHKRTQDALAAAKERFLSRKRAKE